MDFPMLVVYLKSEYEITSLSNNSQFNIHYIYILYLGCNLICVQYRTISHKVYDFHVATRLYMYVFEVYLLLCTHF